MNLKYGLRKDCVIKNRLSQFFLATEQKFVYNKNMTEKEILEALKNLRLERIGVKSTFSSIFREDFTNDS